MSDLSIKFDALRGALNTRHVERYDEIDIALTSLLSRYHFVLIGPPGTAKSMLIEDLTTVFDATIFKYLLTKYTTPEELFGPPNLKAIREGEYIRITEGKLPECDLAFIDEIFKGNSAILNAQLTIMNERMFDNGRTRNPVPLITLAGASNELPDGEELNALFDRFHFRKVVDYIHEPGNFVRMMTSDFDALPLPNLSLAELQDAHNEVNAVDVPKEVTDTVQEIRSDLRLAGILPSDRRFRQSLRSLQAYAWLNDRDVVDDSDFTILQHMFWTIPQEAKTVSRIILDHTNPLELEAQEMIDLVDEIAAQLGEALRESKKGGEAEATLTKQGIEWFGRVRKLSEQQKKLARKAEQQGRKVARIQQAKDRIVRVGTDIGTKILNLDSLDGDI
jgi:MoxR-like ATPase